MGRAEQRRQQKQVGKNPTYTYTAKELNDILGKVHKQARAEAVEDAFMLMLSIPCNILSSEGYWEKTAAKRLPKFVEDCMGLFRAYEYGNVSYEQLKEHLETQAGIKDLIADSRKTKEEANETEYSK